MAVLLRLAAWLLRPMPWARALAATTLFGGVVTRSEPESCEEGFVGGWNGRHDPAFLAWGAGTSAKLSAAAPAPCTWHRIDAAQLPTKAWEAADSIAEPTIVTGMQVGWAAAERWTREGLLQHYGEDTIQVGDSLEMGRAGPEASLSTTTLRNFIEGGMRNKNGQKLYSFDRTINIVGEGEGEGEGAQKRRLAQRLQDDFTLPALFSPSTKESHPDIAHLPLPLEWQHLTLNVGPSGEGLGFHYHDAAINAVVHGAKRWWACPNYINMSLPAFEALKVVLGGEETGFGQDIRMADWLESVYPKPAVQAAIAAANVVEWCATTSVSNVCPLLSCCMTHACFSRSIQQPGETVVVPAGWHHAVVNLGETVALAVQKSGPGGPYEGAAAAPA